MCWFSSHGWKAIRAAMAKVAIVGSFAESLIIFRGALLQEMLNKGNEVFVFAPSALLETQDELKNMGAKYHNIPLKRRGLNPLYDLFTFFVLLNYFRRIRPDIVLSYTIKPVLYGSMAGQLAGIPGVYCMITGRGFAFSGDNFKQILVGKIARFLYRICLRANHKIFFQNPDDLELFFNSGLLKRPEQAVLINGSGVETTFYKPAVFPGKVSFLLIARLIKDKGIFEYIDAARIVKKKYQDIIFYLLGSIENGPGSMSKDKIESWCAEGMVEYLGTVNDVRPAIENASVYVLPSYCEGTPRTVLEAMSMGRPVITTDAPGCKETVRDGLNGFLIPVRDPEALANAMIKFIERPELIPMMGLESRKIVVEKYDVHKVNAVIMDSMGL
jgi:glycosyltransferase involved in cell wall biosynthesis